MKIEIKSFDKKKKRQIEVPEEVFTYPYKEHLIHAAVNAYLAGQRAGTHSTKTRAEITGSNRKPWRQKGTGRARAGTAKSPLWRSGGTAHGPKPRNYEKGLSARERRNALRSALSRKLADAGVVVVDSLELEDHKTQALASRLEGIGVTGKALLVDRHDNGNLALAARNNPLLKTVDALAVNVYDVVDRAQIVLSEAAFVRLVEVLSK